MKFSNLFGLCGGGRSRAYEISEPALHVKCRSNDPKNLKSYETSRKKKEKKVEGSSSDIGKKSDDGTKSKEKKEDKEDDSGVIYRPYISDSNVPWEVKWPDYAPINFTSEKILKGTDYSDPNDVKLINKWNDVDGKIDRRSFTQKFLIENDYPLNPIGRTGLTGRGHLGRWGPNHAADPIVTRWKKDDKGKIVKINGKKVLQFVAIERKDTKEWAIPGGMVDPGEKITSTLIREFMEEATNSTQLSEEQKTKVKDSLTTLFSSGIEVYRGYVDDPRNTDNAWMESTAYSFHDDTNLFDRVKLDAGDDAGKVRWIDVDSSLKLYASHSDFVSKAARLLKAHW